MPFHCQTNCLSIVTNCILIINELIKPARVVYKAVDIPRDILINAFCTDVILVTSNSVNAVPNIKINPVTVPIRPNTKQDSAINQPGEKELMAASLTNIFFYLTTN